MIKKDKLLLQGWKNKQLLVFFSRKNCFFSVGLLDKRTEEIEACERSEKQRLDKGTPPAANNGVRGALDSFGIKTHKGPW